ncbi:MAG: tyrosine-protein phosphatase [Sciscionella sp.]
MAEPLLPSVPNFRDIGGLATTGGARVRHGMLFRSSALHTASPHDTTRLYGEFGIRTVIDLRATEEVTANPAEIPTTARHLLVQMSKETTFAYQAWLREGATEAFDVVSGYRRFLDNAAVAIVGAYRELGNDAALPAVVHCTFGKDRTGVVIAVLLALLGVPEQMIAADYAKSESAIPATISALDGGADPTARLAELPEWSVRTRTESMADLLAVLRTQHGGAAAWAERAGLTVGELDALRDRLLQPT